MCVFSLVLQSEPFAWAKLTLCICPRTTKCICKHAARFVHEKRKDNARSFQSTGMKHKVQLLAKECMSRNVHHTYNGELKLIRFLSSLWE